MPKKVLLSTDIGSDIDDALALLVMLNHPEIDLKGIYTVNGDVEARAYIAKRMVDLAGKEIPVAKGEAKALDNLVEPYYFFEDCLVDESFIDEEQSKRDNRLRYKPLGEAGIIPEGVEDLAERLSREKYVVFNIAPLTNIARLIQKYPESAKNIEQLYLMGCRFSGEALEHNLYHDSRAAQLVFESDIPLTIVPGDFCGKYKMPVEMIPGPESKVGGYVQRMAKAFLAAKTIGNIRLPFSQLDSKKLLVNRIDENIEFILKEIVKIPPEKLRNFEVSKRLELINQKENLLADLSDSYWGVREPDNYWEKYQKLIKHLRDPELEYKGGELLALTLEEIIPKEISIADVYVPYCFLYPEKLMIKKRTANCTEMGNSYFGEGQKHQIIEGFDLGHFKEFLKEYIK